MSKVKVKLLVGMVGADVNYAAGDEAELDADHAKQVVAAGYGEYVGKPPSEEKTAPEKATRAKRETAVKPKAQERGRARS